MCFSFSFTSEYLITLKQTKVWWSLNSENLFLALTWLTILYFTTTFLFLYDSIYVCAFLCFFGLTVPKFLVFFFFCPIKTQFLCLPQNILFKVVRYLTGKYERYATIVCFSVHALYSHTRKFILIWYQSEPYAMSWRLKVRLGQD